MYLANTLICAHYVRPAVRVSEIREVAESKKICKFRNRQSFPWTGSTSQFSHVTLQRDHIWMKNNDFLQSWTRLVTSVLKKHRSGYPDVHQSRVCRLPCLARDSFMSKQEAKREVPVEGKGTSSAEVGQHIAARD